MKDYVSKKSCPTLIPSRYNQSPSLQHLITHEKNNQIA